jgi:hypothetical protein
MRFSFSETVLGTYDVSYFHCPDCGFLRTEEPYWLEEAYSRAISAADTGLLHRNFVAAVKLATILYLGFGARGAFVDVAGGYGTLTRLMRDIGFEFYWEDKYCENLLAVGFDWDPSRGPVRGLTALEVLEHVPEPVEFLSGLMSRFNTRNVIFSTETYRGPTPPDKHWWYYSFRTGQHIAFFRRQTLLKIARRLGLEFFSVHGMHVLSERPISNRLPLTVLSGRLSFPLAAYIRWRLGSRTRSDHAKLLDEA